MNGQMTLNTVSSCTVSPQNSRDILGSISPKKQYLISHVSVPLKVLSSEKFKGSKVYTNFRQQAVSAHIIPNSAVGNYSLSPPPPPKKEGLKTKPATVVI
jgi:hypothetical protein